MRTPTYVRLNVDEIKAMPAGHAATFAAGLRPHERLMIDDDRRLSDTDIPGEWMEIAHKVRIAGRTLKDRDGPIDPTERRGLGGLG